MSKRKNRGKSPNLPEDVLARARQQAGLEPAADQDEAEVAAAPPAPVVRPKAAEKAEKPAPRAERPRESRRRRELRQVEYQAGERKASAYDSAMIAEMLAHPTRQVSEEELHEQYGYVIADLRNMGVLAAVLFVVLIVIAQFL